MAVTIDADGVSSVQTGGNPVDYTGLTVVSSTAVLLAQIFKDDVQSITSVVWDPTGANQALTLIGTFNDPNETNFSLSFYGLIAPATGNKTLRANFSGVVAECVIHAMSFAGASQASVAAAFTNFAHNNPTTQTQTANATIAVTSASGNMVAGAAGNTSTNAFSSASGSPNAITTWGGGQATAGAENTWGGYANGGATETLTFVLTAADWWITAGVNIAAPSGTIVEALGSPIFRPKNAAWR